MSHPSLLKLGSVLGACAAVGAGAGILGSAGASTTPAKQRAAKQHVAKAGAKHRGALRRAVHVAAVVPAAGGTFATVTRDRGIVKSVTGDQLVLQEGTKKATYKTVTITVPPDAIVHNNRAVAKLSDLKPGQAARIVQGPKKTRVNARDRRRG